MKLSKNGPLYVYPRWYGKTTGPISMKLKKMFPYLSSFAAFLFQLINIIDDVTTAIFVKKRGHCHGHSFDPIYLKFKIWVVLLITRCGIVSQPLYFKNFR